MLPLWVHAARPKTLFIGASPILIGTALGLKAGFFHPWIFLTSLVGALLIQIGTNYSNDYFDFLKGADTSARKGPYKVLQQGLVTPYAMKLAFILCFAGGFLCAFLLSLYAGPFFLVIGLVCILFSLLYTAPPFPLAYLGLGDLFVLIFYGPVATLSCYYLQTGHLSPEAAFASLLPGLLGLGPLTLNNLRDYEEDKRSSKKTLVVRFGRNYGRWQYLFSLGLLFFIPILLALYTRTHWLCLSCSLSTLFALPLIKTTFQTNDSLLLQKVFVKTAKIVPLYTALFCLGWLL
ncbi:MAG: 1,4-dihydroxy-2-naphthoate octaprenyltransferase [Chlamydiae bacterium]|nr:1,4-dihydroxy-2-naphthoate octaprenyltransferase [Chlamydiota bacterium]